MGAIAVFTQHEIALGLLSILIGSIIITWLAIRNPSIAAPLFTALTLRIVASLYHSFVEPLPFRALDAFRFVNIGSRWAEQGLVVTLLSFTTGAGLYSWFIGIVYSLAGESSLMIQAINVTLGTLVVYNVYSASNLLWGKKSASLSSWFVAIYPTLVLFSALNLREAPIVFLFSVGIFRYVKWKITEQPLNLLLAGAVFALAGALHTGMLVALVMLVVFLLLHWLIHLTRGPMRSFVESSVLALVVGGVVVVLLIAGWGTRKLGSDRFDLMDAVIRKQEQVAGKGRASYLEESIPTNPRAVVLQSPARILYFTLSPFPWTLITSADFLGFADVLILGSFIGIAISSIRRVKKNSTVIQLAAMLVLLWVAFALGTSNYGTALRHRAKLAPLIFVITCYGGKMNERRPKGIV